MKAKPFLKWAGGKTKLIPHVMPHLPLSFRNYFEPFVGGGAFFWELNTRSATISDSNEDLILAYQMIKKKPKSLNKVLRQLEGKHSKLFFYTIRSRFNRRKDAPIVMAAMFIYLNAKCFRGLCRYNQKNELNAPIQMPETQLRKIPQEFEIDACHKRLVQTDILCGDFAVSLDKAKENDLVILDPPYAPIDLTSNFTAYTADGFEWEDQVRLAGKFRELTDNKVYAIAFNNVLEDIINLYHGFYFMKIPIKRNIVVKRNSKANQMYEMAIFNYDPKERKW